VIKIATAYVLIITDVGVEMDVLDQIKAIDGVEEAYLVYGNYDIITKMTSKDVNDLKKRVIGQFRTIQKIRNTMTLIGVDD